MKRVLLLLLVSMLLGGCADGECVTFDGADYNWDKVEALRVGESAAEVREKIGDPLSVAKVSSAEQDWRYFCRCERTSWAQAGGIKVRTSSRKSRFEAVIRMRGDRVEKIIKNETWVSE